MIDYKRKKSVGPNGNAKGQKENILQEVEEQYLRRLQDRLLEEEEAPGGGKPAQTEEYVLSDSPGSSGVKERSPNKADSELLRTIRELERFHIEKDASVQNGSEEPFGVHEKNGFVRAEEPRRKTGNESIGTISTLPPPVESKPATHPVASTYEPGTILKLENGSVGIFKESLPDKDYDIVLYLMPDGKVEPRGISLFSYSSERIGKLPAEYFSQLSDRMRWERDVIVYHLDSLDSSRLIPGIERHVEETPRQSVTANSVGSGAIRSFQAPPTRKRASLERGRKLKIRLGNRGWEAVYWGSDNDGAILAHNTNKRWELARLNLKQYESSMEIGDYLSSREVKEIEDALLENGS
jgi:hypothetical protein